MTLLFIDSFDHYATADITKKWTSNSGTTSISASGGRRGGGAASLDPGASLSKAVPAASAFVVGAAFNFAGYGASSNGILMRLYDAGAAQCELRMNPDGTLSVTRNGAAVTGGTSASPLPLNVYNYIEWKITIADSIAANSCKVRVNGVDWITVATGQDLKATANASANQVNIGAPVSGGGFSLDDLYICNQSGSANNDFLGDVRIDAVYPTSDGANTGMTPSTGTTHYSLVDDATPNTTDYVESSIAGQKDTYGMGDITHTPVSIFGTQINIAALKDDAGARSIKAVTRSGGTDYSGSSQALGTGQLYYSEIRETDPATSAAWTKTNLNAAEFGAECV
ncbi:hypothetical protein CF68_32970 [Cupriavidus sp. SK-4]|uniref:hypothetical protein n=1 Tax=Cupriavidus sp. SK-4 TaxID=574750 RepID=UPI00045157A9|nr:hypothetical protein [Cupriavidus sp. SK-4]EYS89517.1 hypothetical protein CF68_32970 [Cupriavidus sp. SK-4]